MVKKLYVMLFWVGSLFYGQNAFAVATGIELSSVDIPMQGATITLPGLGEKPIKKTSECDSSKEDCPDPAFVWYFDTDLPLELDEIGTAVINTEKGALSLTFTSQTSGVVTITPALVNAEGVVTTWIDPNGSKTELTYDDTGHVISSTDEEGLTTTYEYDDAGNRISRTEIVKSWQPTDSINVGPKSKVGTEDLGSKIVKGVAGKLLGGLFGGGRHSRSRGPRTKRDPARKVRKTEITDAATGTRVEIRPKWHKGKLLISTNIAKSPDKGTFQSVFLVDGNGNLLGPEKITLYKIWTKIKLTVSWTKSTYVDGGLVSRTSGGWTESWITDLGTYGKRNKNPLSDLPGIWQQMGYGRAHAGARRIGATFNLDKAAFEELGPLTLVVHITRPSLDPVMTTVFSVQLAPGDSGGFSVTPDILP